MTGRIRLLARGAVTTPLLSLLVVVLVAVLSALAVAAPALLAEGRTATVRRAVQSVPDLARWPSAMTPGMPAFSRGSDPRTGVWNEPLTAIRRALQAQPEPLRGLLGAPRMTVVVDALPTADEDPHRTAPVPFNRVSLVSDPGLPGRSVLLEGRMPQATDPADGVEIVLTRTVAEQLKWKVGVQRRWDDLVLALVGVVAPSGHDDGDWAFVGGSAEPLIEIDGGGNRILVGAGFMHVDEASLLTSHSSDIKTFAWMPFLAGDVNAATAERVAAQLRLMTSSPVPLPLHDDTFYERGLQFRSSVPEALDAGTARADGMTPVVTVAAIGPVFVALVVLTLLSRLIAVRRVGGIRVLRARGASRGRLVVLLGGEGLVLGALGAAVGSWSAAAVLGGAGGWTMAVPVVLALVPAIAVPWGALTDAAAAGRRDLGAAGSGSGVRAAFEVLVLAVTGALAVLVATREQPGGADPMVLALTALLGVSGSILTLRLLPAMLLRAERRGARGAALTALLGPARARRDTAVRTAPVLAAVAGLGVAVFSLAFVTTVSGGIVHAAELSVGAQVRVDASYITDATAHDVAAIDGVAAVAATRDGSTTQVVAGRKQIQAQVYVLDRDDFTAVQRGSSTAIPLPASLAERADGDVPVVISQALQEGLGGETGTALTVGGVPARVVGTAPSDAPFGSRRLWVIVDAVNAAALDQSGTGFSQLYLATAPGAAPAAVGEAAVAAVGGNAVFTTPEQVASSYADDPGIGVVIGSLLAAGGIVAVLLVVAIMATLALGARARARTLAILRTLGGRRGAASALALWEAAPPLLLALPFGVGTGIGMALLVVPQLDLRGFVGGSTQPPVLLGGAWMVPVIVGYALVAAIGAAAAARLASRWDAAAAVRTMGEDD